MLNPSLHLPTQAGGKHESDQIAELDPDNFRDTMKQQATLFGFPLSAVWRLSLSPFLLRRCSAVEASEVEFFFGGLLPAAACCCMLLLLMMMMLNVAAIMMWSLGLARVSCAPCRTTSASSVGPARP